MVLETDALSFELVTARGIDGIITTFTGRCIASFGVPVLNPPRFRHSPIHLSSTHFAI